MKFIPFCLIIITMVGCSKNLKKRTLAPSYSQSTEQTFSDIESEQAKALERYRQMRLKDWDSYSKKEKVFRQIRPTQVTRPKVKVRPTPSPRPIIPELPLDKQNELKIEAEQHAIFHCMKNRDTNGSCKSKADELQKNCLEKHSPIKNRDFVNCVKNNLNSL